ncbi:hypothetical protein M7I_2574 [Glarea lozoyensis 74030]|uniref:Uncharacterized protein n=1 Tax=Glarea lozoyensis (strain ATCC 74030 / MF5533) TaxID=1104152 RepID=H0EJ50_GLAL7|nr:hypothetical protein M7I_2574 [Glarea lozoyensis 74030]
MNPMRPPPDPYFQALPWVVAVRVSSAMAKARREKLIRSWASILGLERRDEVEYGGEVVYEGLRGFDVQLLWLARQRAEWGGGGGVTSLRGIHKRGGKYIYA